MLVQVFHHMLIQDIQVIEAIQIMPEAQLEVDMVILAMLVIQVMTAI
jgi:hypothetical protein